jgi:long-chain acyl-CoA synthetase
LGLDSVKVAASGGAPLAMSVLQWFRSVGLHLVEGYGMTETGITHTPSSGRSHPGFVGDGVTGVETVISPDGEVLVRSPMNMVGYFRNPEGTAQAFTEDGFFRTGDLGELDADGWLKIKGRAKEQFKTSKGKYVMPTPIEKLLSAHPAIEGCCVMGNGMPQPFAIVVPSPEYQDCFTSTDSRVALEQTLSDLLKEVNTQLEGHERLQFVVVSDHPWTVSNGLLTPSMKLKRSVLEQQCANWFEAWSVQGPPIRWHITRQRENASHQAAS